MVCYNINNIRIKLRMEVVEEASRCDDDFRVSQVVWAKVTGHPNWPARVTVLPCVGQSLFRVDFFNDNSHAFVSGNKISKYQQKRGEFNLQKQLPRALRQAIVVADVAFQQWSSANIGMGGVEDQVEVSYEKQQQLLQLPPIRQTPLQPKIYKQQTLNIETLIQQPSSQGEQSQDQQQQQICYSRQQREIYVTSLLKKYQLNYIPRATSPEKKSTRVRPKISKHKSRKNESIKVPNSLPKTKKIRKLMMRTPVRVLLARKINRLLRGKSELCNAQRKLIGWSLSEQVSSAQELVRLFKWIEISSCHTIGNFYENWSELQSEREKSSSMTVEEL